MVVTITCKPLRPLEGYFGFQTILCPVPLELKGYGYLKQPEYVSAVQLKLRDKRDREPGDT